jgi:hypothetical protein
LVLCHHIVFAEAGAERERGWGDSLGRRVLLAIYFAWSLSEWTGE